MLINKKKTAYTLVDRVQFNWIAGYLILIIQEIISFQFMFNNPLFGQFYSSKYSNLIQSSLSQNSRTGISLPEVV